MSAKSKRRIKRSNDVAPKTRGVQPERSKLMFNPWLTSSDPLTVAKGNNVELMYYKANSRQRRPKARDIERRKAILHAILSNLAYAAAIQVDPPGIGISIRKAKQGQTRYERRGLTGLPKILKDFDKLGLVRLHLSHQRGIASRIEFAPSIFLGGFKLKSDKFTELTEQRVDGKVWPREVIYLSRTERDYIAGTESRELIDYTDTKLSRRYRDEVQRINSFLAKADIRFLPDGGPLVATKLRYLRRVFNLPPEFQLPPSGRKPPFPSPPVGGRLFGGWWMDLAKERRHSIRINGEPIADLDFQGMFINLAYIAAGKELPDPEIDPYAVPGLTERRWRDGVKKVALAMLFRKGPLVRLPRDARANEEGQPLLPTRIRGATVREAILQAHPELAKIFGTNIGLSLMFTESQILIAAMLRLIDRRIPALPMHDGLMVPASKRHEAMEAMATASEKIIGRSLTVIQKRV